MAKSKNDKKSLASSFLAEAFKNSLGSQSKPATAPGELPMDRKARFEKTAYELGTGVGDVARVVPAMGREFMDNFGKWWDTGTWGDDPTDKDKEKKPKKEKVAKEPKEKLKDFVTSNIKTVDVLENILEEITLLRKLTEGSVKYNVKGAGAKYTDAQTGKFISTVAAREKYKPKETKTKGAVSAPQAEKMVPTVSSAPPPKESKLLTTQPAQVASQPQVTVDTPSEGGSGSLIPDFVKDNVMDKIKGKIPESILSKIPGLGSGAGAAGASGAAGAGSAAGGASGIGSSLLSTGTNFLAGAGGTVLAGVGGVLGGGMFAYDKFKEAGSTQEAEATSAAIDLRQGKITKEEYAQKIAAAEKQSDITKGEGVGGGLGRAAGAIGGAKAGAAAGASIGALFGGVGAIPGAAIGTVVGGLGGYLAGGSIGEAVGNVGGRIKNFFTGGKSEQTDPESFAASKESSTTTVVRGNFSASGPDVPGGKIEGINEGGKYYLNGQEVDAKTYKEAKDKYAGNAGKSIDTKNIGSATTNLFSPSQSQTTNLTSGSSSTSGKTIQDYSVANKDMSSDSKNNTTIVNNNQTSAPPSQPSIMPIKPQARPEASTFTRYMDKILSY